MYEHIGDCLIIWLVQLFATQDYGSLSWSWFPGKNQHLKNMFTSIAGGNLGLTLRFQRTLQKFEVGSPAETEPRATRGVTTVIAETDYVWWRIVGAMAGLLDTAYSNETEKQFEVEVKQIEVEVPRI